jgi:hypothetical protein
MFEPGSLGQAMNALAISGTPPLCLNRHCLEIMSGYDQTDFEHF